MPGGNSLHRPAKDLLNRRNVEDPSRRLRSILTTEGITATRCNEALKALTHGGNSEPLDAIIRHLMANDVDEATALQICGVDPAAEVRGAFKLRRWRDASKRARHDAGADADAAASSFAATSDEARTARTHLLPRSIPPRTRRARRSCAFPLTSCDMCHDCCSTHAARTLQVRVETPTPLR
jgi:hypothetical protein